MARTESTLPPLGIPAPAFRLKDVVTDAFVSREDFSGKKAFLVVFIAPHCPFVKHVQDELARLGEDYISQGVGIVAISPNDAEAYPGDAPDKLKEFATEFHLKFPVLHDESQEVAKAYKAACTPDLFLYDSEFNLVYRGQIDDSRPKSEIPVTGKDIRAALDAVIAGQPVSSEQRASVGCNIKWKTGNEPSYYTPAPERVRVPA